MISLRFLMHAALGALFCLTGPALADRPAASYFGALKTPSSHGAMPIGSYSRGCAAGLVALPESGPTWQAMRLSRNRNYGHPMTIQFLVDLSRQAARIGFGHGLYIGDISQPRGGPAVSGHSSHQTGLDADIWWLPPQRLNLSPGERERISSISMRSDDQRSVTKYWNSRSAALLRTAAMDSRVDRIFVAAAIKLEMCKYASSSDREWMQKIRPWYEHTTHFHVRLKCPKGARSCQPQKPSVNELSNGGDGCDESLRWWVTDYLNPPKPSGKPAPPKKKHPREFTLRDLPDQCLVVLSSE